MLSDFEQEYLCEFTELETPVAGDYVKNIRGEIRKILEVEDLKKYYCCLLDNGQYINLGISKYWKLLK